MKCDKIFNRTTAMLLAAFIAVGGGAYVIAQNVPDKDTDAQQKTKSTETANGNQSTVSKDETVYVLANADGSVKKVIVSDWLKNSAAAASIKDYSELKDVTNVRSDEKYTMNPDNMRVWDADGNDIYYQGTTEKLLPVDISISYQLNGKTVSADQLKGKSGKVTMRFDYKNNQKQTVKIDGKDETVYVPFVMVTGMILDNTHFSNISITNGKIINDGNHSVVMGFAMPGLQESLNISADEFEIPNYVEITADAKDFSLATTMTFASNDVFNNLNLDKVDSLDKLEDLLNEMNSACNKLVDGSSELYGGLSTLLGKSSELISGIDKLAAGTKKLDDGATGLNNGANQLKAGIKDLKAGLTELTGNNEKLVAGAKQTYEAILATANEQLKAQLVAMNITPPTMTIDNYAAVLDGIKAQMSDENVTALVQAEVLKQVLAQAMPGTTVEQYMAAVKAGQIPAATQAQINGAFEAYMKVDPAKTKLATSLAQAKAGRDSIDALKKSLNDYGQLYQGIIDYTNGASKALAGSSQLADGANELAAGTNDLKKGTNDLKNGVNSLKSGSAALVDGVGKLKNGSMELSDGMKEFSEKGVKKLVNVFQKDIKGSITRLRAIVDVSKDYQTFAGTADGTDSTVKFIYKTDSIE